MKVTTVRVRPARRAVCDERGVSKHPLMVEVDLWGEPAAIVLCGEAPRVMWADKRLSAKDKANVVAMVSDAQSLFETALAKFAAQPGFATTA